MRERRRSWLRHSITEEQAKLVADGLDSFRTLTTAGGLYDFSDNLMQYREFNGIGIAFGNIYNFILDTLKTTKYNTIVGALAGFNDYNIINTINNRFQNVQIVVNKNLRGGKMRPGGELYGKYKLLVDNKNKSLNPAHIMPTICNLEPFDGSNHTMDAVRCCGTYYEDYNRRGILHNKYIILCQYEGQELVPKEVIAGSFNYTRAASMSFEFILKFYSHNNNGIVKTFFNNWQDMYSASEPFDTEECRAVPHFKIKA